MNHKQTLDDHHPDIIDDHRVSASNENCQRLQSVEPRAFWNLRCILSNPGEERFCPSDAGYSEHSL